MIRALFPMLIFVLPFLGRSQNQELIAEDGWEFEKSKYEVDVYGKMVEGYDVKAFKVTGLIEASVEEVYKVVMDIEGYEEWYPNCKVGEVLEQPSDSIQYRRVEFGLPWPFDNRDAVNKLIATKTPDSIWIDIMDEAQYIPKLKNVYRVGRTEGFWIIEKETDEQTRLTYSALGEPGGIPKWIINIFLFDSPLEAINNLREVVKGPKYAEE